MKHFRALAGVFLLVIDPAVAQRAQLGIKGRTREMGPVRQTVNPEHRLPRRNAPLPPLPAPLERGTLAALPEVPTSADRTHRLVRRAGAAPPPPEPSPGAPLADPLPRRQKADLSSLPPPLVVLSAEGESSVPNRWRVGLPSWRRYENSDLDAIYAKAHWWDTYNQNTAKGDFPIFGRKNFLNFTGISDTTVEGRRLPTATDDSTARPGSYDFYGYGDQLFVRQDFRFSLDFFRGAAGFEPVSEEIRFTPQFDINYLNVRENGVTDIDVRQGLRRTDEHMGVQELFFEKRLFTNSTSAFQPASGPDREGSAYYDFTSIRTGIQRFTTDFRGFVFSDEQPGARLFGTFSNNRYQYNLAYFNMLEKDTNSGLNTFKRRHQAVYVANLYRQDFLTRGYTAEVSLLYNNDQPSFHIDNNGFLVRPQPVGNPRPHKVRAAYAGFTGDGHIGRINISNAFYQAFGRDDWNPIPAQHNPQHINAQLAALELSYDRDWLRYKASFFYTSGDGNLNDGRARGFDSIVDHQDFAGGGFLSSGLFADRGLTNPALEGAVNLFNRQAIPLTGTGLNLIMGDSLIPSLRTSKDEGQANFLNPGIMVFNGGAEAKVTAKLRTQLNVNYLRFDRTEVLEALLFQNGIRHEIGWDFGFGAQYRPLLSENIVVTGGIGVLKPGDGFRQIYTSQVLYSGFLVVRLQF
jgi:hypothetical protein